MSEENVEIVRALYFWDQPIDTVPMFTDPALFEATRAQLEPLAHPDLETVGPSTGFSAAGEMRVESSRPTAVGFDGFVAVWRDWLDAWERWVVSPVRVKPIDAERVIVLFEVNARSKTHQVDVSFDGANVVTLRDGKVTRVELFTERAEALEAAGLSE